MKYPPLQPGQYYHIYNRANGKEDLFRETYDYRHFLQLYDKYIWPVADTFAWVLMPNHFHLLVRIREGVVYRYSKEDFSASLPPNADRSGRRAGATTDAVGLGGMKKLRFEDVKWERLLIRQRPPLTITIKMQLYQSPKTQTTTNQRLLDLTASAAV